MIFLKKAISVLLILATLVGCCTTFFSCGSDDDDNSTYTPTAVESKTDVILDFDNSANVTKNKMEVSSTTISGFNQSAKWALSSADRSKNKITLDLAKTDLSDYREISFWMYNDSTEDVYFTITLETGDGDKYTSLATYSDIENAGKKYNVNTLIAHPGWHEYKLPFNETSAYSDLTWQYALPTVDTSKNFTPIERFKSNNIVKITLDASSKQIMKDVNLHITSLSANTRKTGTILAFHSNFDNLKNAVAFYEDGIAYLYNQNRYIYSTDSKGGIKKDNSTTFVPIDILAQHRGAQISVNTKEKVTFTYKGTEYTFTAGQTFNYVGCERGFNPGLSLTSVAVTNGDHLTIPMEIAAEVLGYELFYDQMGLVIFSDIPDMYVPISDYNYKFGEQQLHDVYAIIQFIILERNSGSDLIDDMNAIYGEDGHTRLMINQAMFDEMRERLETDSVYASWFNRFESANAVGTSSYKSKNPYFELSDGYRLLSMSRDVMAVIVKYAFLYKMTDNEAYADKVLKTMRAVTKFRDTDLTGALSWHPEHLLDTGEILYGMSIGYDWCYDYIKEEDPNSLTMIEDAIWKMGYGAAMGFGDHIDWWRDKNNLQKRFDEDKAAGLPQWSKFTFTPWYLCTDTEWAAADKDPYTTKSTTKGKFKFTSYTAMNNWNAVCNGGIGIMALAFANVNAEFRAASEYLLDCIGFALHGSLFESYAPEGGYPEGPGYWGYGTSYSIFLFQSIITATGSDQGLTRVPGFRASFYFISGVTSYRDGHWNYHDAGAGGRVSSEYFFWYSDTTADTNIGGLRYNDITAGRAGVGLWDLMFYAPDNYNENVSPKLDYCYSLIGVTTMRSAWTADAVFAGLHGGANAASHGQIDIGTFIVEFGGKRFFIDLGSDEYNLTGYSENGSVVTYFSNPYRYWYYRNRAEGHNTLVINPIYVNTGNKATSAAGQYSSRLDNAQGKNYDQLYGADSKIVKFLSGKNSALSVVDMGCAYREARKAETDAEKNVRGLLLTENRSTVVIQDQMTLNSSVPKVYWMGHVAKGAVVKLSDDRKSAFIDIDGSVLLVEIVTPYQPGDSKYVDWKFELRMLDYLSETGLQTQAEEYARDGMQKLVAVAEGTSKIELAVVFRLLSSGPHGYEWTPIEEWDQFID